MLQESVKSKKESPLLARAESLVDENTTNKFRILRPNKKVNSMLPPIFENVPDSLAQCKQWVCWMAAENPQKGKPDKIPMNSANGYVASNRNPSHWGMFSQARTFSERYLGQVRLVKIKGQERHGQVSGIGFVLTDSDPFCGIDLDNCFLPDNTLAIWAQEIVDTLNSYTEYSPSGTGIRIFVRGDLPAGERRRGQIEMYDTGRYLTVTGHVVGNYVTIESRQRELEQVHTLLQPKHAAQQKIAPAVQPLAPISPQVQDLLARARKAKNGAKFTALFDDGDVSDFLSHSEADLSLCCTLAFWLNRDAGLVDTAFRYSALYKDKERALKWDSVRCQGQTYGQATVSKAIASTPQTFQDSKLGSERDHIAAVQVSPQLQTARDIIANIGQDNIMYVQSTFWAWQAGIWSKIEELKIKQAIQDYESAKNPKLTASYIKGVCSLVQNEVYRPCHIFDADTCTIAVKNGELDYVNGEWQLHPHRRESYRTTQLPVVYDPQATAPRFLQFLEEIFINDEDKAEKKMLVCEAIGYTLLSDCSFEKFFMLIGAGANGKSVLLMVLAALLGQKNACAVQPSQFQNRFQRAHMHGKLANIVTELAEGAEIADAELKAIVSGELTTAEHKHKSPFEFRPFCTCWFGTNHLPHTRDFSQALFRRAIIIQFNRTFSDSEQDKTLKDVLLKELSGILNIALTSMGRVFKNNTFTTPASSEAVKAKWRLEADQVAQFADEKCVFGAGACVALGEMFRAYTNWTYAAGIRRPVGKNTFSSRFERLGVIKDRGTNGKHFLYGVRLMSDNSDGNFDMTTFNE